MIGQQIQNYTIISQLGQGGMGTVYKAVDNVLGREVALKMLNTVMINQPQVLERFKKEAQVLARLLHPNIAVIYNLIEQEQQHFMVMEYVEGKNLDELLRQHHPVPYQMVVLIFMQALEGLHHAHKKGIFHRDIKPSNLILTPYGTVKLMDFGIAKVAGEQRMTQVNKVIGTIEFMAPEIIEGKEPSISSDIYATAVTMYELLSGKLPFENTTDYNLMQEILKKKPASLEKLNASVPKALSNIVMQALEKKPENRFADAGAFQHALMSAFPELRGVDLGTLSKKLETVSIPAQTQVIDRPGRDIPATAMLATRMDKTTSGNNVIKDLQSKAKGLQVKATDGIKNVQTKYLSTTRSRIIAGVVLLLLVFILGFSIFSGNEKTPEELIAEAQNSNTENNKSNSNTGTNPTGDNIVIPVKDPNTQTPTTPPENVQPQQTDEPDDPAKKDQEKKDKEKRDQVKRDQEKKDEEKRNQEKAAQEQRDQEARDKANAPPALVEKPRQSKTIEIKGRVAVKIRLADNIRSVDNLSEGQNLRFVVAESVEYNNDIIIRRGAPVSASIKGIGHVLIEVTINSIESAGGKRIYLDRTSIRKMKKSFGDSDTYTISLGRGVTVNL